MTDKLQNVSRRDFLKVAGTVLKGLAINGLKIPVFDPFDPNRPIPNSSIFKDGALSNESLGFELTPSYKDRNTLKYTSTLKNPVKLNEIVKYTNPNDIQIDPESVATAVNWIIDPLTQEETSIFTLNDGKLIAFFGSKNTKAENRLFDFGSEKIIGSEVLKDHCVNIKFLDTSDHSNSKQKVIDLYYQYDNLNLNFINSQLLNFYRKDHSRVTNISTSGYYDEQLVRHINNRVFGLRFVGSNGVNTTSLLSWENKHFVRLASFPEYETPRILEGNKYFPSIVCLDNAQIGFMSVDRDSPGFETNKFKMSFKIVDSHGLISKLDIPDPEQKLRLISRFDIFVDSETDTRKINDILSKNESFGGKPDDILAILKINKNESGIPSDVPWILVHYPDSIGEYKLEEIKLSKEIMGLVSSKDYPVRPTDFTST